MNAHWVKPPKVPQYPRAAARRSHPECGSRLIARRIHAIQEAGDENKKDLAQRVCENSIHIANNIAIGRHARALGKRDIEFAIDLCERSFDAIVGGVERYMFERFEFPRLCEVVFNKIVASGGKMSDRDLKRVFRNNQSWGNELDRALRYLKEEERIAPSDNVGGSNHKSPGWVIKKE